MSAHPLHNRRVVITRAEEQADSLAERLRALGAQPLLHPAIAFAPPENPAPLDQALRELRRYDWLIVTSANSVRALLGRMATNEITVSSLQHVRVGVVGPATAAALAEHGITANLVPTRHVAEGILEEIGNIAGQRVLLPCADIAREVLAEGLRARGAHVDTVVAYRTVPGPGAATLAPLLRAGSVDAVTFTSSSTVRYLLDGLEHAGMSYAEARSLLNMTVICCIGPITARTARDMGLHVVEAEVYTAEGLVQALTSYFQEQPLQS